MLLVARLPEAHQLRVMPRLAIAACDILIPAALKHISTATTEGYASRPGGAQAELSAEVNKQRSAQSPHKLNRTP